MAQFGDLKQCWTLFKSWFFSFLDHDRERWKAKGRDARENPGGRGETQATLQAEGCCKREDPSPGVRPSPALCIQAPGKVKLEEPARKVKPLGEVRIQTLEEIKREKALQMQQRGESLPAPPAAPGPAPAWRKQLRITELRGKKTLIKCRNTKPRLFPLSTRWPSVFSPGKLIT